MPLIPRRCRPALLAGLALALGGHAGLAAAQPLIAQVEVNGQSRGELFVQLGADGDLLVRREDLPALGLLDPGPQVDVELQGERYLSLKALPGLAFTFDPLNQALRLTADPRLLPLTTLEPATRGRLLPAPAQGGFLNWNLTQALASERAGAGTSAALELGLALGRWQLLTAGQYAPRLQGQGMAWRQLARQARLDQPEVARRWTLGDVAPRPPELGGSAALFGLSVGRSEAMEPGTLRYPLGQLRAEALLPSEVEVYVDGQRVRSQRVPAGPFEIRDLLNQPGARDVEVRVRDPFGRVQRYTQAVYASDRLLRPGLDDYEVVVGRLRDSGGNAYSAWYRRGLTPGLTLGAQAQGGPGLAQVGGSASVGIGPLGVASAHLAASRRAGQGGQAWMVRHDYQAARWGAGWMLRRDSAGYAALSALPRVENRRTEALAQAGWALPSGASASVALGWRTIHPDGALATPGDVRLARLAARRELSLGYATPLGSGGRLLRVSLRRIHDAAGSRTEAMVGLTLLLDDRTLLSAQARPDGRQGVQLARAAPAGPGWGYDLSADRAPGQGSTARAAGQWNAAAAVVRGEVLADAAAWRGSLSASGGIGWIAGRPFASRPVEDAFALVKVGTLAGVPVSLNGVPAGETDGEGRLLLPRIGAYQEVEVGIDTRMIPIELSVPRQSRRLVLAERGGAVVDFPVRRLQAVAARLVRADGSPLVQAWLRLDDRPQGLRTGPDGELYAEDLPPGRHAGQAQDGPAGCHFALEVPDSTEVVLELGTVRCSGLVP